MNRRDAGEEFWLTLVICNAKVVRIDSGPCRPCLQRPLLNEQEVTKPNSEGAAVRKQAGSGHFLSAHCDRMLMEDCRSDVENTITPNSRNCMKGHFLFSAWAFRKFRIEFKASKDRNYIKLHNGGFDLFISQSLDIVLHFVKCETVLV